ncbi:MAG: tetraacyldisaccharide 4'-kinase, partial [Planctomycetes bacterium]|nr:tetraacyldisaccharide 4'-kinase [Planctomycetota bacterium]
MARRMIDAFLRGEAGGPLAGLLRVPLIPAALLFGGVAAMRASLYGRGVLKRDRLPIPVVSVGNLTVGGTGKTPFVRTLVRRLMADGHRPLILGRGYGARVAGELDEEGASLQRDFPDARVVQSPNRFRAALPHLDAEPPFTVAVLDDGAQAMRLHRDLEVL